MIAAKKDTDDSRAASYEAAIKTALTDLQELAEQEQQAREYLNDLEKRTAEIESLIRKLCALLPEDKAAKYIDMLGHGPAPLEVDTNRGGDVFNNVVSLVFRNPNPEREWNSAQIRDELEKNGMEVDTKAILNVLSYLAKTGRMERISRGRYRALGGVMIECGFDLEEIGLK